MFERFNFDFCSQYRLYFRVPPFPSGFHFLRPLVESINWVVLHHYLYLNLVCVGVCLRTRIFQLDLFGINWNLCVVHVQFLDTLLTSWTEKRTQRRRRLVYFSAREFFYLLFFPFSLFHVIRAQKFHPDKVAFVLFTLLGKRKTTSMYRPKELRKQSGISDHR